MKKKIIRYLLFFLLFLLLLFILFDSYPYTTKEDKIYLQAFLKDWKVSETPDSVHRSFEKEIEFISRIQDSVINQIRHEKIPYDSANFIKYYYEKRKGFCYNRSILMEKIFDLYKFQFRHAYVYYYNSTAVSSLDILRRGISSHAILELKTKKGWMIVGSKSNWLGMQEDGSVMSLSVLKKKLMQGQLKLNKTPTISHPFYFEVESASKYKFIYGLYSRHGRFLKSRPVEKIMNSMGIPSFLPDYNIRMLLYNF